jgi:putative restriction endonuclease
MQTIDEAIEWIYGLHVGVVGQGPSRHEKPHKPVLLLAVLDLIASGQVTPDRIPWSQALRQRFTGYFEIYDCQCAACGLRIRMPEVRDLTFVDAAHLIPYSEQPNDHPSNGLALCKNHHWAMDRFLIAPCPDGLWKVSGKIIPHRSPGEKDLADLAGKPLLPPNEPAFAPAKDSLAWRCERLAV